MVLPIAAMVLATAISAGAKAAGSAAQNASAKRAAKRRAKEQDRQTRASLLNETLNRENELEGERYNSHSRLGKRRAQSLMDTAASMREAFNI